MTQKSLTHMLAAAAIGCFLFAPGPAHAEWTAYNDCAWQADDIVGLAGANYNTFSPGGTTNGTLVSVSGQALTGVTASIATSGSGFLFFALQTTATNLVWPAGTDASNEFEGKIGRGYACEISGLDAVVLVTLAGLNPSNQYKLVVWASRLGDSTGYSNRYSDVILSGMDRFTNSSTVADGVTRFADGVADAGTTLRATLRPGYAPVTRYEQIRPGSDGVITFRVRRNAASDGNAYLNAFMLQDAGAAPVTSVNSNYVSSRAPLAETPYVQLPLGSVKANGWLLKQLQLQTSGLTGYSEQIYTNGDYTDLTANNGWLGGAGDAWERAPYYVRGLIGLAYTLDDAGLKTKAQKWIDWTLNNQQGNGNIGPASLAANDWWPRMPMLNALADYYDATGDSRATNVLTKYFQFQNSNTPGAMWTDWAQYRVIDNIEVVLWLYDRSGDAFLLTLADKLKGLSIDWSTRFNNNTVTNMHGVNVAEGYKFPAVWYRRSWSANDRTARANGHRNLMNAHGQPHELPAATEWLAGKSSMQGYELCAAVDRIYSDGISQIIFGDAEIGDQIEKIAFNALPGSLSKTTRHYQYYSLPNEPQLIFYDSATMSPPRFNTEYGHGLMPGCVSGWLCCNYNFGMGWPKFTMYSWAGTESNGLAVMTYAPTEVNAKVANGVRVKIVEDTRYPFEEQIRFTFASTQTVAFPLKLRIPGWCANPAVAVNGVPQSGVTTGTFFTVNRIWTSNDTVTVDLPMTIKAVTQTNNSVSLERGPLIYSLKIGENWVVSNPIIVDGLDFSQNMVYPTTAWNYALALNASDPAASLTVNTAVMPSNPFEAATTPVTITAKARRVPTWLMAGNGLPTEVPVSPIVSTQAEETVTLIPFGAENLRMTYFPNYAAPIYAPVSTNFTAYNDCAWTAMTNTLLPAGDSSSAIFTTNSPLALLGGHLMDTNGGDSLAAQVTFSTNAALGIGLLDRTLSPPSGTDADHWFTGKVGTNCAANWSGGSIGMAFSALDTGKLYNIVIWSTRGEDPTGKYSNRFTDITISGVAAFNNRSSARTELSTISMANDRTRVRSALTPGLVARYDGVRPATNGSVLFTLTAGSDLLWPAGGLGTNAYLNAFMIQTTAGDTALDSWKLRYFETTDVDVSADPDFDGVNNLEEYIAGANPTNGASKPAIGIFLQDGARGLDFSGTSQRLYTVDGKTTLSAPWQPVFTDVAGSNAMQTILLNTTNRAMFYRFRVKLTP